MLHRVIRLQMTPNILKKNCIFVMKFIGGPQDFLHLGHLYSIHEYKSSLSEYICSLKTAVFGLRKDHNKCLNRLIFFKPHNSRFFTFRRLCPICQTV